ncbi:TolB family protein [Paremcibacter congregatus]|uniref:Amidohydrolase n=1 Tax=Paremcibacter congregatus TaxID=2043170 RepID=A0A2G4YR35_9PROT|nr:PD40 domain-containing protein [Paremcibacter congregatus]PHZ84791.1 hypothetical protein CRD36_10205 [Paremcibacter congregatus]QDE26243.1 hypothetical protein FIV45_02585 [Paremcibacter congregatus]
MSYYKFNKQVLFSLITVVMGGVSLPVEVWAASSNSAPDTVLPLKADRKVSFETNEGTWMSVDVSPNGKTIVFDLLGYLYVLDIEGGQGKPILEGMAFDAQPVFSPDVTWTAFISDRSGSKNLWMVNADGTNPQPLTHESEMQRFTSLDGDYVCVSRQLNIVFGELHVWMYHKNGGSGVQITGLEQKHTWDIGAEPTPDGTHLFYSQMIGIDSSKANIIRKNLETREDEYHIRGFKKAMRPRVSSDGKLLVYITCTNAYTELRQRDLQIGEKKKLLPQIDREPRSFASQDFVPGYSFTPNSQKLVISLDGKIHLRQFIKDRVTQGLWLHESEYIFDKAAAVGGEIFRAGGKIGVGSHGNLTGLGYHWESQALAFGGLTPHEVLQITPPTHRSSVEVIGRMADVGAGNLNDRYAI